jgi:hypothetical protein
LSSGVKQQVLPAVLWHTKQNVSGASKGLFIRKQAFSIIIIFTLPAQAGLWAA